MTNAQIQNWIDTYGYFAAIIAVLILGLFLLSKFWPKLVAFVNSVEVVRNLPVDLAAIKLQIAVSSEAKDARFDSIQAALDGFNEQAKEGKADREALHRAVEEIRHEVRPNGGSSMKDALLRLEQEVALIKKANPVSVAVTTSR
jgi:hypothetical protein